MKNKKITKRKKSSKVREEWAHLPVEKRPVILDELKVKGFRYPLERNRVFKVNANKRHAGRGWWKCKRIIQWPDGLIEIDAIYQNTEHRNSRTIISMRACELSDVKSITKRVVHGKGMVPPRQ